MFTYPPVAVPPIGRVLKSLLIANVAVFVFQALFVSPGGAFVDWFALSRDGMGRLRVWQLFTYTLLHGGSMHLLMNMIGLYFFGRELESALGERTFLRLYVLAGVVAGLGWLVVGGGPGRVCIGASGAVYGVLGMYAALYPRRRVTLLLFLVVPVTLSARALALGFMGMSFLMMLEGGSGVAHAAHLFGGLSGYWLGHRLQGGGPGGRGGSSGGGPGLFDSLRAHRRRNRFQVLEGEAWEADDPVPMAVVDALLEKIKRGGIGALTARERALLERASSDRHRGR